MIEDPGPLVVTLLSLLRANLIKHSHIHSAFKKKHLTLMVGHILECLLHEDAGVRDQAKQTFVLAMDQVYALEPSSLLDLLCSIRPFDSKHHLDVVLESVAHNQLTHLYLPRASRSWVYDPRPTNSWFTLIDFTIALLQAPFDHATFFFPSPMVLSRSALTRGVQHQDVRVKLKTLLLIKALAQHAGGFGKQALLRLPDFSGFWSLCFGEPGDLQEAALECLSWSKLSG